MTKIQQPVLCVSREAISKIIGQGKNGIFPIDLNQIPLDAFSFINRNIVDSKEEGTSLIVGKYLPQILGYVTVYNKTTGKFLTYARGKEQENRLVKRSLGVGGHCDIIDVLQSKPILVNNPPELFINPLEVLYASIKREVKEEIKGNVCYENSQVLGLISDQSDQVGQVHLGYSLLYIIENDTEIDANLECLTDPKFLSLEELISNKEDYENWSQIVIEHLQTL